MLGIGITICLVGAFWTETRPQEFTDGTWDDILYISRRLFRETLPSDAGAIEFIPRLDANRDGYSDLIQGYYSARKGIIWVGGPNGYSSSSRMLFDEGGSTCEMADLNIDGWPEAIFTLGWNRSDLRIYWGSQSTGGPDPGSFTSLPVNNCEAVYAYDLDQDTYLDIIAAEDRSNGKIWVFWGEAGGYSPSNYSIFSTSVQVCYHIEVADLNKDGYRDVIYIHSKAAGAWGIGIVFGDGTPRDLTDNPTWSHTALPGIDAHGLTVADFNKDGWLDIAVSQWANSPSTTRIYFSDNGTFGAANMIELTVGECFGGNAAWDFNGDGWLDLIFFRAYFGTYPLLICLNSGSYPYYTTSDTIPFGLVRGYSCGTLYDLNGDGRAEVYTKSGDTSLIYWGVRVLGGLALYDSLQKVSYPGGGEHGTFRELGNTYNREPYAWYESGIFHSDNLQESVSLSWIAWDSVLVGSELRMFIRTRWDDVSPWSSWRQVANGEYVSEPPYFPARDIQYRAEFWWNNPAWLPWLERVQIETIPLATEEVSVAKGELVFGSGKGLVWISWPGEQGEVSLYSADGRRVGEKRLNEGRTEFRGLTPGVYYLIVKASETRKEKIVLR